MSSASALWQGPAHPLQPCPAHSLLIGTNCSLQPQSWMHPPSRGAQIIAPEALGQELCPQHGTTVPAHHLTYHSPAPCPPHSQTHAECCWTSLAQGGQLGSQVWAVPSQELPTSRNLADSSWRATGSHHPAKGELSSAATGGRSCSAAQAGSARQPGAVVLRAAEEGNTKYLQAAIFGAGKG